MSKKRKLLAQVKFKGGARMKCYYVANPPDMAKEANDHLLITLTPEKGRGKANNWYMNGHDVTSLIWVLAAGASHLQQLDIPMH